MTTELTITSERIDDFPLLLAAMQRLELPAILDRHLVRHGLQQGLSWGWIATIWLAHILSQGDHRKLPVRAWVRQAGATIMRITGLADLTELDFTDDRLTIVLRRLSVPDTWDAIEQDLGRNILRVYQLTPERVRLDATTVSGYHAGGADSVFQFGHSKDDPTLRQVKVMVAALDPLGLPLVTEVVAGNAADDPLYVPAVDRVLQIIDGIGLLFVGDCKMSALATRAHIAHRQHYYLCPLPLTGATVQDLPTWIAAAGTAEQPLAAVYTTADQGKRQLCAEGYTFERSLTAIVADTEHTWTERVLLVRSESYRKAQQADLERRLQRATAQLRALTPTPGRGKRQMQTAGALVLAANAILDGQAVTGLLTYAYERQEQRQTKYLGRGRGGPDRPYRTLVTVRYQITAVSRQADAMAAQQATLGWRAYVTNAPAPQLTLADAVLTYRDEWLIERGFHRLKGTPLSLDPLFVKRDDQVIGLTNLLSIAVRLLTLLEFVVRRQLKQNQEHLVGLIANNPKKGMDNPTTERLLKAFDDITLTIVQLPGQIIRHVTPLSALQIRILELLGLSPGVYTRLAEN
ncbi:MAG: IS1634 family transposase [Chloroflexi bacterium]|nr:IS1634 family transposase [Chloroflexota bacterium]